MPGGCGVSMFAPGRPVSPSSTAIMAPWSFPAQRRKLVADPAVKAVMDFFDGSITNVRRLPPAGGAAEEDENES